MTEAEAAIPDAAARLVLPVLLLLPPLEPRPAAAAAAAAAAATSTDDARVSSGLRREVTEKGWFVLGLPFMS